MLSRRQFLKVTAAAGAGLFLSNKFGFIRPAHAFIPGGTLDPSALPKYVTPLVIPPAMPRASTVRLANGQTADYYEIAMRQLQQAILPSGWPTTTVWGYGSDRHSGTLNYPGFTIEARYNRPVRVKWINGLVDGNNNYRPHLLPVDPTLHWANPAGPRDTRPTFTSTPTRYTGPVPIVTHVHGAHATDESDGYAEAWYLPNASNIPSGYFPTGTWYRTFAEEFRAMWGVNWEPGSATFQYQNNQRATTVWYHDHALGMTRLNVYAGPAGFYLIRGGPDDVGGLQLPGPGPQRGDPPGYKYCEIPIAIQDRAFNADGSLFYPDTRAFFDEFGGPFLPESNVSPIWNPEFFGNTMVVNGKSWPVQTVEQRRYRFRLLNGCDSRFLILKLVTGDPTARPGVAALPFWQIGAEGGFLPAPVSLPQLLMSPAERADVIVDFTHLPVGTEVYLINEGPDEPFRGGVAGVNFPYADPLTTGQVMKFVVEPRMGNDPSMDPALGQLTLPRVKNLGPESVTRKVALLEEMNMEADIPIAAMLGTMDAAGNPQMKMWADAVTETPALGATEVWEIYNFTADAHPIHIHEVMFQVVNRQALAADAEGIALSPAQLVGGLLAPEAWETAYKDTVIAYPGQVTRVKIKFDLGGLYVWHCHIVEHEDNEMMRPYSIGGMPPFMPPDPAKP